jgi:hypothetical protein
MQSFENFFFAIFPPKGNSCHGRDPTLLLEIFFCWCFANIIEVMLTHQATHHQYSDKYYLELGMIKDVFYRLDTSEHSTLFNAVNSGKIRSKSPVTFVQVKNPTDGIGR